MLKEKFVDLSHNQQMKQVKNRFHCTNDAGWFTHEGVFVGRTTEDVIAALIDLEDAEINAIGDCMTGCSMLTPKLEDFVRKS